MDGTARIAVDIGGTFTDLVLLSADGRSHYLKQASTPDRPEVAVIEGIETLLETAALAPSDIAEVLHGTTVGSNTLLQKQGAVTGLITTKGFRDVLEIGRVRTPDMFDLTWKKPEPLVPRRFRREVDERITTDGKVLTPLDTHEVVAVAESLAEEGVRSIAICFLNSYRNPEHEHAAEAAIRAALPEVAVTSSVSVLPEIKEYERTSTAVVNAYVLPVLQSYIARLEDGLHRAGINAPLLVSNSNGGLAAARTAQEKPVFFISSGRSAGVVGATHMGRSVGEENLIVFDMGGTTASAALVHEGALSRTNEYEFRAGISTPSRFIKAGGYMMRVPTVDVAEVGSGGGSIAWVDEGGMLNVGPLSAGAEPGPACYATGGDKATVTDANVVLGLLPPALAGGALALDVEAARSAIADNVAKPLGLSVEDAAIGIRDVANVNMARAIRAVTVERGVDPREFTLLGFGGSGPVHACDLARVLNIGRIVFPPMPGVFTAMGMLAGDVERYFIWACPGYLRTADMSALDQIMSDLTDEAETTLREEGYAAGDITLDFEIDLRFEDQDNEVAVALTRDMLDAGVLRQRFIDIYRSIYQYASDDEIEIVNLRLIGRGVRENKVDFANVRTAAQPGGDAAAPARSAYFDRVSGWSKAPVLWRESFAGVQPGPAIIESSDSTIVVPPGASASLDAAGNIIVEL